MSVPEPRINTFFQKTSKTIVDPISKIFMVAELIIGINRLPIIATTNTFWIVLMLCYSIFLNLFFVFATMQLFPIPFKARTCIVVTDHLQFLLCTVFAFMLRKRLLNFYANLNNFDKDIGINQSKFGIRESVCNFLQLLVTVVGSLTLYFLSGNVFISYKHIPHIIPMKLITCLELHYYGHLISLLIPRLKALNNCMKYSYLNNKNSIYKYQPDLQLETKDRKLHLRVDMKRLMDFYNKIIIVYDSLNEAVKWQMLTLLISTFSITLCSLYHIVKTVIDGHLGKYGLLLVNLSEMSMQLFPLLIPCVFADRVQREVRLIKDYLACRLYENTFDKPNRSTARTLLALIETRSLSFSLFNMFDIDISLPFKFIALLLTYLIIILQFDKVISPNGSTYL